jgi:ketosteroid isomerase-like protein
VGEARQVMDAVTDAVFQKDLEAAANRYAPDAVMVTPDQAEIRGREQIIQYLRQFNDAFPDNRYEPASKHESGDTAIDEGYFVGTHTAPLPLPTGESLPATGRQVRVRACDIATVQNGVITSHRFYFDQMEFLGQLGLMPEPPS